MELSTVVKAALVAVLVSSRTPSEQEESVLMVKPSGLKSGLRAVRAACRSWRDLLSPRM